MKSRRLLVLLALPVAVMAVEVPRCVIFRIVTL